MLKILKDGGSLLMRTQCKTTNAAGSRIFEGRDIVKGDHTFQGDRVGGERDEGE